VSEKLYQEINLYQPIFRRQRHIFSAVTMLQSAAVVVVALLTIYGYGLWQLGGLEAAALQLEGREKAYSAQLARLDPSVSLGQRAAIERELDELNATLLAQQRLVDILRSQPLGSAAGFSAKLAALGRRHTARLWLTHIRINGITNSIELVGRSTDPAMVPAYLLHLGEEEALAGQRFDQFDITRDDDGNNVGFRVSSEAVAK
jgi:hypothetical protein